MVFTHFCPDWGDGPKSFNAYLVAWAMGYNFCEVKKNISWPTFAIIAPKAKTYFWPY